jgi:hypothetical protein
VGSSMITPRGSRARAAAGSGSGAEPRARGGHWSLSSRSARPRRGQSQRGREPALPRRASRQRWWGGVGEGGSLRVNAVIASHGTTGRAWKSKHEMKRWPALSSSWLSRAFWERRCFARVPVQPCCRVGVGGRGGAHRGTGLKCWRHRVRSLSKSRDPLRISCASATQAHA